MRIFETDKLRIDKIGSPGGEAYLARTPEHTLLYDSGFAYSAPALIAELEELLAEPGKRELDYLFLTHSHYDHASGSVWIKKRWPHTVILASAHTARVFERPGAREVMKRLNHEALEETRSLGLTLARAQALTDYSLLDTLTVDVVVGDGSVIDLGSVSLEVITAPGHTRCSLMLWCPEERLLFGSESLGVLVDDSLVAPAYLTGYADSLATIARAQSLHPEHILPNHKQMLSGKQATQYLENAKKWAEYTAQLVWDYHDQGKSKDEIAAALKEQFYASELRAFQPEPAFDLNNSLLIDHLLMLR